MKTFIEESISKPAFMIGNTESHIIFRNNKGVYNILVVENYKTTSNMTFEGKVPLSQLIQIIINKTNEVFKNEI